MLYTLITAKYYALTEFSDYPWTGKLVMWSDVEYHLRILPCKVNDILFYVVPEKWIETHT